MTELRKQYQELVKDGEQKLSRIEDDKSLAEQIHIETLKQLKEDTENEIKELRQQYEEKLAGEREDKVRLRGQAGIHRKHHEELRQHMAKREEELKAHSEEEKRRKEKIEKLLKEREENLKQIKEKDKTIGERELRIYDLKKTNQVGGGMGILMMIMTDDYPPSEVEFETFFWFFF